MASPSRTGTPTKGEVTTITATFVEESPTDGTGSTSDIIPESSVDDCCFSLQVLATLAGTDNLKNDQSSVLFRFGVAFTSASLDLEKYVSGAWTKVADLTDNTYGTLYDYQFYQGQKDHIGYLIDWSKVLNEEGEGSYRVKATGVDFLGNNRDRYSFEFCLKTYSAERAENTVRIDFYHSHTIGDLDNPTQTKEFPSDWFNQIRIPGWFGEDRSEYEQEVTRYRNGLEKWIKDIQREKYTLRTRRLPESVHDYLKNDVFQADKIEFTDYNKDNPNSHVGTPAIRDGNYEPNWRYDTKLASVVVEFRNLYDNLQKKHC